MQGHSLTLILRFNFARDAVLHDDSFAAKRAGRIEDEDVVQRLHPEVFSIAVRTFEAKSIRAKCDLAWHRPSSVQ